jgi:signal transduction histidine kinase
MKPGQGEAMIDRRRIRRCKAALPDAAGRAGLRMKLPVQGVILLLALATSIPGSAQDPPALPLIPHQAAAVLAQAPAASATPSAALSAAHSAAPVPIYESWYFYLALLFIGITLPAHLFRRRMMLMKGRIGIVLEERSRIARECHDTLMAGFAAISWQLEATAKLFRDSGLDSTPAAESCELARSMVAHCQAEARRIIWDLRETDEVTGILSQALARSLAANHASGAVKTRLEVEGEEIPLAPGCVHHLVCIGQEAVTNAIRHAQPAQILVHVKYDASALSLSVRDDGRGYQTDRGPSRHGHFGIAVMEERARKLGGSFRIQELSGSGTEVVVRIPFHAIEQPSSQGQHVIRWIGI